MRREERPTYRKWLRFYLDFCSKYRSPTALSSPSFSYRPRIPPAIAGNGRTTGPRTKPPQRFKPAIDGRRFEIFDRDEMLAIVDQINLGELVESKLVPPRLC